ncbi:MAG: TonB-dependent receptor [Calditrichaeota bacterium]|nr:TonB-dependent receptor [Calditrichota bacterium]
MRKLIFLYLNLLLFYLILHAGTTGKLSGVVTDVRTGEPLAGVNVYLEGTSYGSSTDQDGFFYILNIPPGRYTLIASYVGYKVFQAKNVKIDIDLTTTLNIRLEEAILEGETVVVVSERPIVTPDISNSQLNVEAQTIEAMPVQTVNEVLTLQAGIEMGSEGILIRGGSADQTLFMLDGLSLNDERSNVPSTTVSLSSVKEVQIQTGGFNAEYGQARSGIVNVITREGSTERYSGNLSFLISPPAPKHFGPSIYDPNSYFNRPYLDPAVCWTGTNNGAWDDYTRRQYPNFEGWESVSEATLKDDDPTNDLTPEGAKRLYEWQHRRQGDIKKPDYTIDMGFGGPVPIVSKTLGNLRFYFSYYKEQNMFVFPLSRDHYGQNSFQTKITSDISKSMKLVLTNWYQEEFSVSPYQWKTAPTGRVLKQQSEIANLLNSSSGSSILYMPGYFSPTSIYRNMFGIKFIHALNTSTYYELNLQHKQSRYHTYKMADRDTTRKHEILPGLKVDDAPYGYWGYGVTGIDGMSMGGWMNLGRDKSKISTTSLKFDITSQIHPRHQIKSGLEFVYNDFGVNTGTFSPSMNTWTRSLIYSVFPYRFAVYVQDKMEYMGFIANMGVRFDYSDANTKRYVLSPYDEFLKAGYGNLIEKQSPTEKAKANWSLSPRLGIAHPITANSKLYFNYGHFRSEPPSSFRFRIQRESNGLVTHLGDPNLGLEKTVAYELGYEHNLFNKLLLKVAAYYKDVTNQVGWVFYQNIDNSVQYSKATNNNYQDIRGFEITLQKKIGRWVTGFLNYTYDVRTSGYFGLTQYWEDPNKQREYLRLNPYQEKPRPRPYARANIDFHTPVNFGPQWIGGRPLADWTVNIIANWKTGAYDTYNPNNIPGVVDNVQWRDWYNVDLRLSRAFRFGQYQLQFFVDIDNVFNHKYLSRAGFSDQYDYLDYLESLNLPWEEGVEKGHDRIGDYRPVGVAYDPLEPNPGNDPAIAKRNKKRKETKSYIDMPNIRSFTFLNPRDITFGIRISF